MLPPQLLKLPAEVALQRHKPPGRREILFPGVGEGAAVRPPLEDAHTNLPLRGLDGLADSGLRDPQAAGRPGYAPFFIDRKEMLRLPVVQETASFVL